MDFSGEPTCPCKCAYHQQLCVSHPHEDAKNKSEKRKRGEWGSGGGLGGWVGFMMLESERERNESER